jgi:DNA-directed RNA polymerase specialized sigma24 family protein
MTLILMDEITPKRPSWFLPNGEAKTSDMIEQELDRIRRLVYRMAYNDTIDREQLVLDTWLEDPSAGPNRVRSRVIDALRSITRRDRAEEVPPEIRLGSTVDGDHINHLARTAALCDLEQTMLYLRFWQDMTMEQIAAKTGQSTSAARARFKAIMQRLYLAAQNDGL